MLNQAGPSVYRLVQAGNAEVWVVANIVDAEVWVVACRLVAAQPELRIWEVEVGRKRREAVVWEII